ncbi:MAG: enoyl-CoA hydratase/isomerase family protein [Phycisphaerales bacterium]|nr:enoyl-CoA hydratase/isomerase family protein [Phycisphaerales bacterium]
MIRVDIQDEIAIVSLNRPDKRNALVPAMLEQLDREINECAHKVRALVLVGEGKSFCAGFDLKLCADDPGGETMRQLLTGLSAVVRTMRVIEIPVVLGMHGAAVAGGCALLGGADIVVADEQAKLGYPVVKIGVSPAVSAAFMMASITPGAVRTRLLDTELISGADALRIGLVHETVENREDVLSRCIGIAQSLASKPGSGVKATKAWLNEITEPMTSNAQRGLDVSLSLTGSPEEQERLAALWGK